MYEKIKRNNYPGKTIKMKYIITTALVTFGIFTSSCSCQLSGSASADVICDPAETVMAI